MSDEYDGTEDYNERCARDERAYRAQVRRAGQLAGLQPVWFYRWVPGQSLKREAITRDGKTLYGPVRV